MNNIDANNNINIDINNTHLTESKSIINPKTRKYRAYDLVEERIHSRILMVMQPNVYISTI